MPALSDYEIEELAAELLRHGARPSHAQRLLHRFYLSGGQIDARGLQLGRKVQSLLGSAIRARQSRILRTVRAADQTEKLLIGFDAGGAVEAVWMPSEDPSRAAGCVSCQIGCAMGCRFCASTRGGLERDLTAGEIVEQFLHLRWLSRERGRRLSTLVFMGIGEPLLNLANVLQAIRRIASPDLGELGGRHITVSTVGIVPGIDELAQADLNVHLAVSLHAADDKTRSVLIPANHRYPVAEVMAAARRFQQRTGRIVNVEYCMLAGVNDSDAHAADLAALMQGFRAHVNLIPYNASSPATGNGGYRRSSQQRIRDFRSLLVRRGLVVHVRRPRGCDVLAACGQLRAVSSQALGTS